MEVTLSVDRCADLDLQVFHLSVPGCIVASTVSIFTDVQLIWLGYSIRDPCSV